MILRGIFPITLTTFLAVFISFGGGSSLDVFSLLSLLSLLFSLEKIPLMISQLVFQSSFQVDLSVVSNVAVEEVKKNMIY